MNQAALRQQLLNLVQAGEKDESSRVEPVQSSRVESRAGALRLSVGSPRGDGWGLCGVKHVSGWMGRMARLGGPAAAHGLASWPGPLLLFFLKQI